MANATRSSAGNSVPNWIPPPMATNNPPPSQDDTVYLIVIVLLCVVLVGFAPILIDMYFETKMQKEQNKIEMENLKRLRREVERMIREKT